MEGLSSAELQIVSDCWTHILTFCQADAYIAVRSTCKTLHKIGDPSKTHAFDQQWEDMTHLFCDKLKDCELSINIDEYQREYNDNWYKIFQIIRRNVTYEAVQTQQLTQNKVLMTSPSINNARMIEYYCQKDDLSAFKASIYSSVKYLNALFEEQTILFIACKYNSHKIVKYLVSNKRTKYTIIIDKVCRESCFALEFTNPIIYCINHNRVQLLKLLLSHPTMTANRILHKMGAIDHSECCKALKHCIRADNIEVIKLLYNNGVAQLSPWSNGFQIEYKQPIELALISGSVSVSKYFLSFKEVQNGLRKDTNGVNFDWYRILENAWQNGLKNSKFIEFLVENREVIPLSKILQNYQTAIDLENKNNDKQMKKRQIVLSTDENS